MLPAPSRPTSSPWRLVHSPVPTVAPFHQVKIFAKKPMRPRLCRVAARSASFSSSPSPRDGEGDQRRWWGRVEGARSGPLHHSAALSGPPPHEPRSQGGNSVPPADLVADANAELVRAAAADFEHCGDRLARRK